MKKQSLKDKLDEHLGAANKGKKKQPMKSRRHESEGMEHTMGRIAIKAKKPKMKKK